MKKSKKLICALFIVIIVTAGVFFINYDLSMGFVNSLGEKFCRNLSIGYDDVNVKNYSVNSFEIPGLDDDFIPQSVCYVEKIDMYAVSGYVKGSLSRIYLIDKENEKVKKLYIDDYSEHAGGIAANKNDVYVSSGGNENEGGYIYHINADVLKNASDGSKVKFDSKFQVYSRASALYAGDEMLFVCEFYEYKDYPVNKSHYVGENCAISCGYKFESIKDFEDNSLILPDIVLSIPNKVQGMSITQDDKIVFSTSYGRKNDSVMYVFDDYNNLEKSTISFGEAQVPLYICSKTNQILKVKMPTLMEGMDYYDGKLYVIFESGAKNYSNAKEIIDNVWEVDINNMLK